MSGITPIVMSIANLFRRDTHVVGVSTTEGTPRVEERDINGDGTNELYPDHQMEEFTWDAERNAAMYNFFVRMDPGFPFKDPLGGEDVANACNSIAMMGAVPTITWEPDPNGPLFLENGVRNPQNIVARINSGEWDFYFTDFFRQAKAWGGTMILRPLHEMNIPTYPWGMTVPDEYKAAFQRIAKTRNDAGANNVLLAWSPDASSPANIAAYWPGKNDSQGRSVVDVIGLDGYIRRESGWKSPEDLFEPALAQVRRLAAGAGRDIPIGIFEFGYEDGVHADRNIFEQAWDTVTDYFSIHQPSVDQDKAEWIEEAYEYFADNDVRFSFYFNQNKHERIDDQEPRPYFYAFNSDATQLAFRDATEGDEFVKSFDGRRGASPDRSVMMNRLFSLNISMPSELNFLGEEIAPGRRTPATAESRVLERYQESVVQLNKLIQWLRTDGRQVWSDPHNVWVGDSARIRDTQRLLAMGELLTTMGKFDLARMVYGLIPRKQDGYLTQMRKIAALGMTNNTLYRADIGDMNQTLGRFHWIIREAEAQRGINRNPNFVGWGLGYRNFFQVPRVRRHEDLPAELQTLANQDQQVPTIRQIRLQKLLKRSGEGMEAAKKALADLIGSGETARILRESMNFRDKYEQNTGNECLKTVDCKLALVRQIEPSVGNRTVDIGTVREKVVDFLQNDKSLKDTQEELARIEPLPLPSFAPYRNTTAGWWEIDDIGFLASAHLGQAVALIGRPDSTFDERRTEGLPHVYEAYRLFRVMNYEPWHVLDLEPQINLALASTWESYANLLAAADKARVYTKRVLAARKPFETRRWDERVFRSWRGNEYRMEYPRYYQAEAALIEADIRSKKPDVDEANEALRIIKDEALPQTLVRSQRARAFLIMARANFNLQTKKGYATAQRYATEVKRLQQGRSERDGLLLGADLILADIDSIIGGIDNLKQSAQTYRRIVRLYREVREPTFYSVQAEFKLALAYAQGAEGGLADAKTQVKSLLTKLLLYLASQEPNRELRQYREQAIRAASSLATNEAIRDLYAIVSRDPDTVESFYEGWGLDLGPLSRVRDAFESIIQRAE